MDAAQRRRRKKKRNQKMKKNLCIFISRLQFIARQSTTGTHQPKLSKTNSLHRVTATVRPLIISGGSLTIVFFNFRRQ
jgi:hypothetical protein